MISTEGKGGVDDASQLSGFISALRMGCIALRMTSRSYDLIPLHRKGAQKSFLRSFSYPACISSVTESCYGVTHSVLPHKRRDKKPAEYQSANL